MSVLKFLSYSCCVLVCLAWIIYICGGVAETLSNVSAADKVRDIKIISSETGDILYENSGIVSVEDTKEKGVVPVWL